MRPGLHVISETSRKPTICVCKGGDSPCHHEVLHREPGKRLRRLKCVHLIVDLYVKRTAYRLLTLKLVDHIIDRVLVTGGPST